MAIVLDGEHLTIENLVAIARNNEEVQIAPASLEKIKECRLMLEDKIKAREIMYGINTPRALVILRPLNTSGVPLPAAST